MNEDLSALINALAEDQEFRDAFLNAPNGDARRQLAQEHGLAVPTEQQIHVFLNSIGATPEDDLPESEAAFMVLWYLP